MVFGLYLPLRGIAVQDVAMLPVAVFTTDYGATLSRFLGLQYSVALVLRRL